jgi:transcriptional regulator with XRE-family HTH domain
MDLSQEEFADLCQLDRTYVSMLERGRASPTLRTLYQICEGCGINLSDFIAIVETHLWSPPKGK